MWHLGGVGMGLLVCVFLLSRCFPPKGGFFGFGSNFTLLHWKRSMSSSSSNQNSCLPLRDKPPPFSKCLYALQELMVKICRFSLAAVSFRVSLNLALSLQIEAILEPPWNVPILLIMCTKIIIGMSLMTAPGFLSRKSAFLLLITVSICLTNHRVISTTEHGTSSSNFSKSLITS